MENKKKFHLALVDNNGHLSEMELGELFGFDDEETRQLIAQLLSEHKIVYDEESFCNYRVVKGFRGENRRRSLR